MKTPALYQTQTAVHLCVTIAVTVMLVLGDFHSNAGTALAALVALATGSNTANGIAQVRRNGNAQNR